MILGPTPALIIYALDQRGRESPVRLMLLRKGATPSLGADSYDSIKHLEQGRWTWSWPFWRRYQQATVQPAITTVGGGERENRLVHLPGHVWRNATFDVGGFAYYLDDGLSRPLLLATVYDNPISSVNDDFTLQPSTANIEVHYQNLDT